MALGRIHGVVRDLCTLADWDDSEVRSAGQLLQDFAARRDESAFAVLVRRHGPMVLGVCRRILRHEHDAEDAFQGTFLLLARKATAVRWQESVDSWLYEVASRIALKAKPER